MEGWAPDGASPQPCRDWAGPAALTPCSAPQCPHQSPNACHRACLSRLLQGPGGRAWKDKLESLTCLGPGITLWACLCPLTPAPLQPGPQPSALGVREFGNLASPTASALSPRDSNPLTWHFPRLRSNPNSGLAEAPPHLEAQAPCSRPPPNPPQFRPPHTWLLPTLLYSAWLARPAPAQGDEILAKPTRARV